MLDGLVRHDLRFTPVSSFGRSGSTYLMALLRAAGVAVADNLPFEDRMLQIGFIRALATGLRATLPGRQDLVQSLGGDYHSLCYVGAADDAESAARLDARLAALRGGWLAEKVIGVHLLRMMRAFDETGRIRPIYLLRDPRDIFLSVKAFNRKRNPDGQNNFGAADDDARMFRVICEFQRGQVMEQQRGGGLLLHYEDLITQRDQSLIALLRHLERRDITIATLAAIRARTPAGGGAVLAHMTSATAAQSIGRWRGAEGAPYHAMFAAAAEPLNASGYA